MRHRTIAEIEIAPPAGKRWQRLITGHWTDSERSPFVVTKQEAMHIYVQATRQPYVSISEPGVHSSYPILWRLVDA